jgi:predicted ATP-grasp superfamily ATP-dependent carboligase
VIHCAGKPGAIILGGHFLGLGAARMLRMARAGIPVWVMDEEVCIAQFSRHVSGFLRCPPPEDEAQFHAFLLETAAKKDLAGSVVFACTDEFVKVLARGHERLSQQYVLITPPWETAQFLYDKRLTHRLALQQGVPMPETQIPGSLDVLVALDIELPVVLKPAITSHLMDATKKKAYRADNREALLATFQMMAGVIDPSEILIQELIPGRAANLYSFFGLFKDGEIVTGFSAKRSRQHPMEFGRASTFVETVCIPELGALATRLLTAIGYSGLAEVEFMYDPKHGRYELLEVNPRIWGWHTLASRAGVNLMHLAYAQAIGEPMAAGQFREGAKWVHLLTDIPTAALEIWHGRLSLHDYLRSMRGSKEFAVLSLDDPLPVIMELLLVPYYASRRGF